MLVASAPWARRCNAAAALLAAAALYGCDSVVPPALPLGQRAAELPRAAKNRVLELLEQTCGDSAVPRLPGDQPAGGLRRGAALYRNYCAACHGSAGHGDGPAAAYLDPPPRDFTSGAFKFSSTGVGSRPIDADLKRTIGVGLAGTAMPGFWWLGEADVAVLANFVRYLAIRGEIETILVLTWEVDEAIDEAGLADAVEQVVGAWQSADDDVIPVPTEIVASEDDALELGKAAFLSDELACYRCHAADGRGRPGEVFDLTTGLLRGGSNEADLYRRIFGGIPGTAMPSYANLLSGRPDTVWHLVCYVRRLAGVESP